MNKILLAQSIIVCSLALTAQSPATAATTHQASMTCREFLSLNTVERPKVVYWAEGVKHAGKPRDAVIDIADVDQIIPVVVERCTDAPQASFWKKLDEAWHNVEADVKKHL